MRFINLVVRQFIEYLHCGDCIERGNTISMNLHAHSKQHPPPRWKSQDFLHFVYPLEWDLTGGASGIGCRLLVVRGGERARR